MKKTCASLLIFALCHSMAIAQQNDDVQGDGSTASPAYCPVSPIQFSSEKLMPVGQVKVEANRTEIIEQQVALFSGNVDITSDTATIHAEQARINNSGKELFARGDVVYRDAQVEVGSDTVDIDSVEETLTMSNTEYRLNGSSGHGNASSIAVNAQDGMLLRDVSFSTCPPGEEDWAIQASEISIRRGRNWGEAKHTRFYLGGVPVFYLPYFAFPITNQRQTGFLFPELSNSSSTGVGYEQPFYWNMAENYDMTLTPRLMTKRGVQLKTQFRHLSEQGYSQVDFEYLPEDTDMVGNPDRYFYRFYHRGQLNENWLVSANLNGLSDDNYIVDLGSQFYNRADAHLSRTAGLSYFQENMTFDIHVRDFETIGNYEDTYRALPEAKFNYIKPLGELFEFRINSELAYFESTDSASPKATRFHVEPTIALPYQKHWGEFTAEASLLNTYYRQDNTEETNLDEDVNRTLERIRLYGALYFEREESWFNKDLSVTLEPQVQYLYTSYEDQTGIGLYDTTFLRTDVKGLFRGQEFTGIDRINDNNQVTVALTSRFLDSANREQFAISVGQIFYLEDNQVMAVNRQRNSDRSLLAAEIEWRLYNDWTFHTDFQVAPDDDKVERSSTTFQYQLNSSKLFQLTHRYVRELSGETIDQIGVTASWPINNEWKWVGRSYRDMENNRSVENYIGIQYESCCWAVQIIAQRYLSNRYSLDGSQSTDEFDTGVALQFTFKGMGAAGSSRRMLSDGLFGDRQPYNLN